MPYHDGRWAHLSRFRLAWLSLCASLALHVVDEAANDFLSYYNPNVLALRARVPWLRLPTFEYGEWLAGLMTAVALLAVASMLIRGYSRGMAVAALVFGGLMLLNGVLHLAVSAYLGRLMPGAWSSPLLILTSAWLLREAHVVWWKQPSV
jgi:Protein of unknown function with HXXEE motif